MPSTPPGSEKSRAMGIWDPQLHLPFPYPINPPPPLRPQERWRNRWEEAGDSKERPGLPPGFG